MGYAFFDIDHTIISGTSAEKIFVLYLLKKRKIKIANLFKMLLFYLRYFLIDYNFAKRQNKYYLKNESVEKIHKLMSKCFDDNIKSKISQNALNKIKWHKQNGDKIILLSGIISGLGELMQDFLQADDIILTKLEINRNRYTGKIFGEHPYGIIKKKLYNQYLIKNSIGSELTYGYANDFTDKDFLESVNNPVAVNPDKKLFKIAKRKNWPIAFFDLKE